MRRILQVDIDRDRRVGVAHVEAGGHRRFLAEIARQVDDADARIVVLRREQAVERRVGAAVVDEDEVEGDALLGQHLGVAVDRLEERRDRVFLVVDRNDQRDRRDQRSARASAPATDSPSCGSSECGKSAFIVRRKPVLVQVVGRTVMRRG